MRSFSIHDEANIIERIPSNNYPTCCNLLCMSLRTLIVKLKHEDKERKEKERNTYWIISQSYMIPMSRNTIWMSVNLASFNIIEILSVSKKKIIPIIIIKKRNNQ